MVNSPSKFRLPPCDAVVTSTALLLIVEADARRRSAPTSRRMAFEWFGSLLYFSSMRRFPVTVDLDTSAGFSAFGKRSRFSSAQKIRLVPCYDLAIWLWGLLPNCRRYVHTGFITANTTSFWSWPSWTCARPDMFMEYLLLMLLQQWCERFR